MAIGGIRANIIANYLSQAYVAAAGILALPAYMHFMSAEAYGLIGFYTMLQAWFQLLDAGLSAALVREASRFNSGMVSAGLLIRLKRLLEACFSLVGAAGIIAFLFLSDVLSTRWLHVERLSFEEVTLCVALMGPIIAFRWQSCLYRSVITGLEQQVWLGGVVVIVATLRFILCIPVIALYPDTPSAFFAYQIGVSFIEMALLWWKARREMPRAGKEELPGWAELRPVFRFVASISLTNIAWIVVTQSDKLALSRVLPLSVYGHFTVAAQLATGITLLNTPIATAVLPRMARLFAEGNKEELANAYRLYSHLVAVVIVPPACTLLFFAPEILHAWTGEAAVSNDIAAVLAMYALGNCLAGLSAFAYYIQYAHGNVRLHMLGQGLFVVAYIPLLYLGIVQAGAMGAAASWLLVNLVYFLFWVALTHRTFLDTSYLSWLAQDVGPVFAAAAAPFLILLLTGKPELDRVEGLVCAAGFGCLSLGCVLLASPRFRPILFRWFRGKTAGRQP